MTGLRAVTRMAFRASQPSAFSRLAAMPTMHLSVKARMAPMSTCIISNRLWAMMGIITFSSNCPAWPASITARSLPMTWKEAMLSISARTGFTLPGMMLLPGCTAGRWISSRPVAGPLDSRRRSLAMRSSVTARVRIEAEKSTGSAMLCIVSNKLSDSYSASPVSPDRVCTMRRWYSGWALRPEPVAVPPMPRRRSPSAARRIRPASRSTARA